MHFYARIYKFIENIYAYEKYIFIIYIISNRVIYRRVKIIINTT